MMKTLNGTRQRIRLWPTLAIRLEVLPWHWLIIPWGYLHLAGGLTFMLEWLFFSIHFGCTMTPRAAKKLKKANEDTNH